MTQRGRSATLSQISSVGLRVAGNALEFGAYILLARRLGPSLFGQISVALVIVRFTALLGDSGAGFGGTREIAERGIGSPDIWAWQRRREQRSFALAALFAVVAVASGHAVFVPFAIGIIARGAQREWMALGRGAVVRAAVPGIVHGSVLLVGALFVTDLGPASVVVGVGAAIWLVATIAANRRPAIPSDATASASPHIKSSGAGAGLGTWGLVTMFADSLVLSLDIVLLSIIAGQTDAGIYSAVYRVPNALQLVIGLAITSAIPHVVALRSVPHEAVPHEAERLRRRCIHLGLVCGLGTIVVGAAALVAVNVVFGDAYSRGRGPLVLLLVATTFLAVSAPLRALQLVTGHDRTIAAVAIANSVFVVIGYLVTIPIWGMMGAAGTTAAAQLVYLVFFVVATRTEARDRPHVAEVLPH